MSKKGDKKKIEHNATLASTLSRGCQGISLKNELTISALGLEVKRADQHKNESMMFALSLQVENVKSELQRLERKAERWCPDYD
eukprot:14105254-Ditylum_brightwellii.AAC.1